MLNPFNCTNIIKYNNKRSIQYISIPNSNDKSTIKSLIKNILNTDDTYPVYIKNNCDTMTKISLKNKTMSVRNLIKNEHNIHDGLFIGERGYGFNSKLSKYNPFTIVGIVEPLERFMKIFKYVKSLKGKPNVEEPWKKLSVQWENSTISDMLYRYARYAGRKKYAKRHEFVYLNLFFKQQMLYMAGYECCTENGCIGKGNMTDEELSHQALMNLNKTDVIIVDNNIDSLQKQLRGFNIKFENIHLPPKSFNATKPRMAAKAKSTLMQLLHLDYNIYDKAKELQILRTQQAMTCLN